MTKILGRPAVEDGVTIHDATLVRPSTTATGGRRAAAMSRALPLVGLLGLVIFYTVTVGDRFMTVDNWANLVQQASVVSIVGFGLTFVVMAGSIDLSVGSVAAFAGMSAA